MFTALRILAILTLLLALFVASYGAYVRLNDAGLDCPDWPGCYGQVTPPNEAIEIAQAEAKFDRPVDIAGGWKEMIHRYVASALGLLILVIAALTFIQRTVPIYLPWKLVTWLVLLVCFQGALGYWTVSEGVHPIVVTGHLTFGMLLIGSLAWYALYIMHLPVGRLLYSQDTAGHFITADRSQASQLTKLPASVVPTSIKSLAIVALIAVVLQIILGGWTSTNYTAAYCTDFPGCEQYEAIPSTNFTEAFWISPPELPVRGDWEGGAMSPEARKTIHMAHRVLAVIVTVVLLILIVCIRLSSKTNPRQRALSLLVLALLVVQLSIGIMTALSAGAGMPVNLATLHNTGAALLLCALLWLNFNVRYDV